MTSLAIAAVLLASSPGIAAGPAAAAAASQDRTQAVLYQEGTEALDREDWDRAAAAFGEAATLPGERADGALYWQAYALNRRGRRDEALQTLTRLRREHAKSRWLKDARALEFEIRGAAGQPASPERFEEDELKLLALSSLMNANPERAVPLAEHMLASGASAKLRDRVLFVLAQSASPEARSAIARLAESGADPDLQARAVRYLGLFGGPESRQRLIDRYNASQEPRVRKAVLQALMLAGDRAGLAAIASKESDPDLQREAVQQLGVLGARQELSQLYQQGSSAEMKRHVIDALFVGGAVDQLTALALKETDPAMRREAIQRLGLTGAKGSTETLTTIYASDADPQVRKAVLSALFVQGNAGALIDIARREQDPDMKAQAVQYLSLMKSKEAMDYMMEVLK